MENILATASGRCPLEKLFRTFLKKLQKTPLIKVCNNLSLEESFFNNVAGSIPDDILTSTFSYKFLTFFRATFPLKICATTSGWNQFIM